VSTDFGKPNVTAGHPIAGEWDATLQELYTKSDSSGYHFVLKSTLPAFTWYVYFSLFVALCIHNELSQGIGRGACHYLVGD